MRIESLRWQDTLAIRQAVLWPNKPQEFCHVKGDSSAWHYGVFIEQKLVCVASVYPSLDSGGNGDGDGDNDDHNIGDYNDNNDNNSRARLRKFATLASYQKQGIGSFVLKHIIDSLKAQKINIIWCDARETALEFYQRFGFRTEGQRFYKNDIPYFKMQLDIFKT